MAQEFVIQIKEIRRRLHLTQEQLAAQIGVTYSTVNRWESGKTRPSPLARKQIQEILESIQEGKGKE